MIGHARGKLFDEECKNRCEAGNRDCHMEAVAMVIQKGQGDLATKSDLDNERVELKNDINCIG